MRFLRVQSIALAAVGLISQTSAQNSTIAPNATAPSDTPKKQSIFVAPDQNMAFGLTIPPDSSSDLLFTLAVQQTFTWGAVGLGSTQMAGSLVLMVYSNAKGDNITFSPRIASSHAEPAAYSDLQVDLLSGTGLTNGTYIISARCRNCRSWPGVDVSRRDMPAIYALGPQGSMASDDPLAPLKFHDTYGTFSIDMVAATGGDRAPELTNATTKASSGATLQSSESGKKDWASVFHAIIMVFCLLGLMPFGVLLMRLGHWVRWHAVNQCLALVGVLVGMSLGIYISLLYNRSNRFNHPHQVIGLIVVIGMIAQFGLGFFHHRMYKKTKQPAKLTPYHVWLGRVTITLGVLNGFLGFPFAQAPGYNWILAGLVIAIVPAVLFLLIFKRFFHRLLRKVKNSDTQAPSPPENTSEPWRNEPPQGASGYGDSPPRYQETSGPQIGMVDMSQNGRSERALDRADRGIPNLGPERAPREYV